MYINKFDKAMLETAVIWSKLSSCTRRKVGAVISYNDRIISNGYNGTVAGTNNECEDKFIVCTHCHKMNDMNSITEIGMHDLKKFTCDKCNHKVKLTHSEIEERTVLKTNDSTLHAEENAILDAAKNGKKLEGSTMYITCSPCKRCSNMIAQVGIKKVVYMEDYKDLTGIDFLKSLNIEVIKIGE
jgi:dCMP deaminase